MYLDYIRLSYQRNGSVDEVSSPPSEKSSSWSVAFGPALVWATFR
jgi:hypothetical protein